MLWSVMMPCVRSRALDPSLVDNKVGYPQIVSNSVGCQTSGVEWFLCSKMTFLPVWRVVSTLRRAMLLPHGARLVRTLLWEQ